MKRWSSLMLLALTLAVPAPAMAAFITIDDFSGLTNGSKPSYILAVSVDSITRRNREASGRA